jgi:hypothetical protein
MKQLSEKLQQKENSEQTMESILDNISRILEISKEIETFIESYKHFELTKLDKIRVKLVKDAFDRIKANSKQLELQINSRPHEFMCDIPNSFDAFRCHMAFDIDILDQFADESFGTFPNVELWLLADDIPVGACNFTANDLIWSDESSKRGRLSAKMVYVDVKSLNAADGDDLIKQNVARVKIYLWLGYEKEKEQIFKNSDSMLSCENDYDILLYHEKYDTERLALLPYLPKEIAYKGKLQNKR